MRRRPSDALCSSLVPPFAWFDDTPSGQELPAAGPAPELAVLRDDLAAGQREHWDAPDLDPVERVVAGPGVESPLVQDPRARGVEQDEVRVAPHGDGTLPRVQPEDACRVRGEGADERLRRDPTPGHAL